MRHGTLHPISNAVYKLTQHIMRCASFLTQHLMCLLFKQAEKFLSFFGENAVTKKPLMRLLYINKKSAASRRSKQPTKEISMAKVIVQVTGGSKQEKTASTVQELKNLLGAGTYTANVNGEPADNSQTLQDFDFVVLAPAVKGAI